MQSFLNHRLNLRDSNPISLYNFSLDVPLIAPVIAMQGKHFIEHSQFVDKNFHYLVDHRSNYRNQGEAKQKIYKL